MVEDGASSAQLSALRAENDELRARVAELEAQGDDDERTAKVRLRGSASFIQSPSASARRLRGERPSSPPSTRASAARSSTQ